MKNLRTFKQFINESGAIDKDTYRLGNIVIKTENESGLIKPSEIKPKLVDGWRLPTSEDIKKLFKDHDWYCYSNLAEMYIGGSTGENEFGPRLNWDYDDNFTGDFEGYGIYMLGGDDLNKNWLILHEDFENKPIIGYKIGSINLRDIPDFPCQVRLVKDIK